MKKAIVVLICIFFAIIISLYAYYQNAQNNLDSIAKYNMQYEKYFDKEIYGSDVVTLINMAIDNNVKYNISKNEDGRYIEDNKYCIKIIIKFKDIDTLYEMESIDKAGIDGFIKNFSNSTFKVVDYKYNEDTNRIGKLTIEEIKIGNI